jgi:hypothetical protein
VWQAFDAKFRVAPAPIAPLDARYGITMDTSWLGLLSPVGDEDTFAGIVRPLRLCLTRLWAFAIRRSAPYEGA